MGLRRAEGSVADRSKWCTAVSERRMRGRGAWRRLRVQHWALTAMAPDPCSLTSKHVVRKASAVRFHAGDVSCTCGQRRRRCGVSSRLSWARLGSLGSADSPPPFVVWPAGPPSSWPSREGFHAACVRSPPSAALVFDYFDERRNPAGRTSVFESWPPPPAWRHRRGRVSLLLLPPPLLLHLQSAHRACPLCSTRDTALTVLEDLGLDIAKTITESGTDIEIMVTEVPSASPLVFPVLSSWLGSKKAYTRLQYMWMCRSLTDSPSSECVTHLGPMQVR